LGEAATWLLLLLHWHATVAHHARLHLLHARLHLLHARLHHASTTGTSTWTTSATALRLEEVVLLHVAAHFVIINALLQLD
jgi:hypothetical protein